LLRKQHKNFRGLFFCRTLYCGVRQERTPGEHVIASSISDSSGIDDVIARSLRSNASVNVDELRVCLLDSVRRWTSINRFVCPPAVKHKPSKSCPYPCHVIMINFFTWYASLHGFEKKYYYILISVPFKYVKWRLSCWNTNSSKYIIKVVHGSSRVQSFPCTVSRVGLGQVDCVRLGQTNICYKIYIFRISATEDDLTLYIVQINRQPVQLMQKWRDVQFVAT